MTKMRILWLCHFTNNEIQDILPLWKKKSEFASWIPNMVKGFENSDQVELHIISPHEYLKHKVNIVLRNVHYHFIPIGIPVWHRHWPRFFRYDIFSDFNAFRSCVTKIVIQIKPDLINLIGAENAYYSSAVFDMPMKVPVLVTIQGFIGQLKDIEKPLLPLLKAIKTEEIILTKFKFFCGEQDSSEYIKKYNPDHVFFRLYFPVNEQYALNTPFQGYKYDCIYFGRLTKTKGAEDFLYALAEIKKVKKEIRACMVGAGNINEFKTLTHKLDLDDNVTFTGFVKTQKELFDYIKTSKVFLVPPYKERLSSTLREAMFLKVAIVAYATGGIPYINEFDEHIYLVNTGDYREMARKSLLLLDNEAIRINLAEKAFQYAIKEFSLRVNVQRVIDTYQTILNNNKTN